MSAALLASPWKGFPIVGDEEPLAVPCQKGTVYELFTDAQLIVGDSGVTYPLVFVVDGSEAIDAAPASMLPFHKLRSGVLLTQTNSVLVFSTVDCRVWMHERAPLFQMRLPVPSGAACGCSPKPAAVDDDEGCGCDACKLKKRARW